MKRIVLLFSMIAALLALGLAILLLPHSSAAAQDIGEDECLDFECDVEGVSLILGSTDSFEIDTYSATFVSFDLLDEGYEAYVEGYLYEAESLIDDGTAFDDGSGAAELFLSDPLNVGSLYDLESDHYEVDEFGEDFTFLGTTVAEIFAGAPHISSINPTSASLGTTGTLTILGSDLFDEFTGEIILTPQIPGVTFSFNSASPDGTQVVLNYTIASNATAGDQSLQLATRFGASNPVTFHLGDATPSIVSVNPSTWQAGTNTVITIIGSHFGTNPAVSATGPGVTGATVNTAADTQIQATVTIDPTSPGGTGTVTVTSRGYDGRGFISTLPGQTSGSPSFNVTIVPIQAPPPQILYFGNTVPGLQSVTVGQQIALTAQIPTTIDIASYSWSLSGPGGVIKSFSSDATNGEQPTALTSMDFTQPGLTFYWVSTGGLTEALNPVNFSYCLVNQQCSAPITANFDVTGPNESAQPTITTTQINVLHGTKTTKKGPVTGDWLVYQSLSSQAGITFLAPDSTSLPASNQGSYQWVQMLSQDAHTFINKNGAGSCSTLVTSDIELDTAYPYQAVQNSTRLNGVLNDTAVDVPAVFLASAIGEWRRVFMATMYLRWIPDPDGACTAGAACTIPVPLGKASWKLSGCAINRQKAAENMTNWIKSCPGDPQQPQTVIYQPTTPAAGNNFGYVNWSHTAPTDACANVAIK